MGIILKLCLIFILICSFICILVTKRVYSVLFLVLSYVGVLFFCLLFGQEFVAIILLLVVGVIVSVIVIGLRHFLWHRQ